MRSRRQKSVAAALSAVLFWTQSFPAHAEGNLWSERAEKAGRLRASATADSREVGEALQMAAGLNAPGPARAGWLAEEVSRAFVPAAAGGSAAGSEGLSAAGAVLSRISGLGSIRSIRAPRGARAGAPLVLLVQDAHGVPSAQINIAKAILALAEEHPDLVVGLEGAAGALEARPFQGASAKINRQLGELYFQAGLITGPELAAFAAPVGTLFMGVEDAALYMRNVRAVQGSFPQKVAAGGLLQDWVRRAGKLKSALWPEELQALDKSRGEYEAGRARLSDHVEALAAHASPRDLADLPQLSLFRELSRRESSFDFAAVGRERAVLLTRLGERLPAADLAELVEAGVSLRMNRLKPGAYYRILNQVLRRSGLSASDFPLFQGYVDYVIAADAVRPEAFIHEIHLLEDRLARSLGKTPAQAELWAVADDLSLAAKLAGFRMTPVDWERFEARRSAVRRLPARLAALEGASPVPAGAPLPLEEFERFYLAAEARNGALAGNLLRALADRKGTPASSPVAVLVCGGFHADALSDILLRGGAWVAVMAPGIDEAELSGERDALAAFTRVPTAVEALFEPSRPSLVAELALSANPRTGPARWARNVVAGSRGPLSVLLSRLAVNRGETPPEAASVAFDGPIRVSPDGSRAEARQKSLNARGRSRTLLWSVSAPGGDLPAAPGTRQKWSVDGSAGPSVFDGKSPSLRVQEEIPGIAARITGLLAALADAFRARARKYAPQAAGALALATVWILQSVFPPAAGAQTADRRDPLGAAVGARVEGSPEVLEARARRRVRAHKLVQSWVTTLVPVAGRKMRFGYKEAKTDSKPGWLRKQEAFLDVIVISPKEIAENLAAGDEKDEAAAQVSLQERKAARSGLSLALAAYEAERHAFHLTRTEADLSAALGRAEASLREAETQLAGAVGSSKAESLRFEVAIRSSMASQLTLAVSRQKALLAAAEAERTNALGLLGEEWLDGTGLDPAAEPAGLDRLRAVLGEKPTEEAELSALDAKALSLRGRIRAAEWSRLGAVRVPLVVKGDETKFIKDVYPWVLWEGDPLAFFAPPAEAAKIAAELRTVNERRNKLLGDLAEKRKKALKEKNEAETKLARGRAAAARLEWAKVLALFEDFEANGAAVEAAQGALSAAEGEERILRAKRAAALVVLASIPEDLPAAVPAEAPSAAGIVSPVQLGFMGGLGWQIYNNPGGGRTPDFWTAGLSAKFKGGVEPMLWVQLTGPVQPSRFEEKDGRVSFIAGVNFSLDSPPARKEAGEALKGAASNAPEASSAARTLTGVEDALAYAVGLDKDAAKSAAVAQAAEDFSVPGNFAGAFARGRVSTSNDEFPSTTGHPQIRDLKGQTLSVEAGLSPAKAADRSMAFRDLAAARAAADRDRARTEDKVLKDLARFAEVLAVVERREVVSGRVALQGRKAHLARLEQEMKLRRLNPGSRAGAGDASKADLEALSARWGRLRESISQAEKEMDKIAAAWKLTAEQLAPAARDLVAGNPGEPAEALLLGLEDHPEARLAREKAGQTESALHGAAGVLDSVNVEYKRNKTDGTKGKPDVVTVELAVKAGFNLVSLLKVITSFSESDDARQAAAAAVARVKADLLQSVREARSAAARLEAARAYLQAVQEIRTALESNETAALSEVEAAQTAEIEAGMMVERAEAALRAANALQREKARRATGAPRPARGGSRGFIDIVLFPVLSGSGLLSALGVHGGFPWFLVVPAALFLAAGGVFLAGWVLRSPSEARRKALISEARRALGSSPGSAWEKGAGRSLEGEVRLLEKGRRGDLAGIERRLRLLRFLQGGGANVSNGNLDPKFGDAAFMALLTGAEESPAAAYLPSERRPAVVPAVHVLGGGKEEAGFLTQRLRELRETPNAVLPLVTQRDAFSAADISSLKNEIAAELLGIASEGWTRGEIDALFTRLRFGHPDLVVTAKDLRGAGQSWIDPAELVDARVLRSLLRQRASRVLGLPAKGLTVNLFTLNPEGFSLAPDLEGFRTLLIRSSFTVVDVTERIGRALEAFERVGQSA